MPARVYYFKRMPRDWMCSRCAGVVLKGDLMAVPSGAGTIMRRLCARCFDNPRRRRKPAPKEEA